ncbi:MAG: response regulator, partial [Serpentinimonas sp.]|nr:response regulator [Serpentinimonas sp.]
MDFAQTLPPGTPLGDALERRPRLLVVDDQPVNVQLLYRIFAADHQVFAATDGLKALEIARQQQPDLILLDVVMPGLDGFEVCQRLQADELTRDIPVIFLT